MDIQKRLYMILYPNNALVGSMLPPDQFATHYQVGSNRYYSGKLIFAEVDIAFRHPYFENLEPGLAALVPHEDGKPKATKFICSYRVLEHIDFQALRSLYLASNEGHCLELKRQVAAPVDDQTFRIFGELCPVRMVVLTSYSADELAKYVTKPGNPKGCPKIFFTQIDVNVEEFLQDFAKNPFLQPPVPSVHPSKLRDAVESMRASGNKTKGLSLNTAMGSMAFKKVAHGFWLASQEETVFYRMPSLAEIEETNFRFFKSM